MWFGQLPKTGTSQVLSMNKEVIVSVYGGLGNQMFQYATGTALAQKNQAKLVLDLSWFASLRPPGITPWNFSLDKFPRTVFSTAIRGSDLFLDRTSLRNIAAKAKGKLRRIRNGQSILVERHFHYDASVLQASHGTWLMGYWQSPKYFQNVADTIREQFGWAPLSAASERISDEITQRNSVCLHVRRGDYLATVAHPVCDSSYYDRAIRRLLSECENTHFFIFSDDPEWARYNLPLGSQVSTFVDVNGPDSAHEDLLLMSRCKHFIIANSTFSWWGAWLSTHPEKTVTCPINWFGTDLDTKDLIPPNWRRL